VLKLKKNNSGAKRLMKLALLIRVFEEFSNIKFHENASKESRVVRNGRTDREADKQADRLTDMTKLVVAF